MPRIKRVADRYDPLRRLLHGQRGIMGYTYRDLAERLHCSPETARSRCIHPGTLTVDELRRYATILDIPADELRSAIPFS